MTSKRTSKPRFLHHGQAGFSNSDPAVVMGDFPWCEMDWWDHADVNRDRDGNKLAHPIRIHFTPAQHWSRRAIWPPRSQQVAWRQIGFG